MLPVTCIVRTWTLILIFQSQMICIRGACGVPERLVFAIPKDSDLKDIYLPGTKVSYDCRLGYKRVPRTDNSIICLDNFTWSIPSEFCTPRECGNPGDTLNGDFTATNNFFFGSRVTYYCNEGYRLSSRRPFRDCKADGTWSNVVPQCEAVLCVPPYLPVGGTYNPEKDEYTYQDSVTFECNKGLHVIGATSAACTSDGTWSASSPTCKAVCDTPPKYENAALEERFTNIRYFDKTTVFYKCRQGFQRDPNKSNGITCTGTSWSKPEEFCSPISCGDPGEVSHAKRLDSKFTFKSKVRYNCEDGYMMTSRTNYRECQADGSWTSEPVICKAVCTLPPELEFAVLEEEFTNQKFFDSGKTVQYKCRPGFVTVTGKSNNLTCLDSLKWSQHELFCIRKSCGNPGAIKDGQMQYENFLFGSRVHYACDPGYTMIAKKTYRECQADGTWSGKSPLCKGSVCDHIWELQEEARKCTSTPDEWIKYLQIQYLYLQIENLKLDNEIKKLKLKDFQRELHK